MLLTKIKVHHFISCKDQITLGKHINQSLTLLYLLYASLEQFFSFSTKVIFISIERFLYLWFHLQRFCLLLCKEKKMNLSRDLKIYYMCILHWMLILQIPNSHQSNFLQCRGIKMNLSTKSRNRHEIHI